MIHAIRLLLAFLRIGAMNELAYRANFFFQLFRSLGWLISILVGLAVIFGHTDTLGGWKADELLALVGVYVLVGGLISFMIEPSMAQLMGDVQQGTLDFTLTKPADGQLLVSIQQFRLWESLNVIQGVVVIVIALVRLHERLDATLLLGFAVALAAGTAIVYSFWLILATCSFWVIRANNLLFIFQSMYEAGRWPVGIYPKWLRWTLTFLVPVAFAVTVPAGALVGRMTPYTLLGAVVLAFAMLIISRWFWKTGVKRYSGASA